MKTQTKIILGFILGILIGHLFTPVLTAYGHQLGTRWNPMYVKIVK